MSRFSEKRLAQDLAQAVSGNNQNRRRVDLAVFVVSVGVGAFGNFYFGKVEIGAIFLALALAALGDLISSFWPLRRFKRIAFDVLFLIAAMAVLTPGCWGNIALSMQR